MPLSTSHSTTGSVNSQMQQPRGPTAPLGQAPEFELPPLPYRYDGLEPCMDRETLTWHHDVLHREFVEQLNATLKQQPDLRKEASLEEILARISDFSPEVRVFAGGHWNHSLFFSLLTDRKEDQEITPELLLAINESFGSLDEMKTKFVEAAISLNTPGWVWLIQGDDDPVGRLSIVATQNEDNPLMDVALKKGRPVLGCDLWRHAFHSATAPAGLSLDENAAWKSHCEDAVKRFFVLLNWSQARSFFLNAESALSV